MQDETWRDEYRRAAQLARWIESMEDQLSFRTRRTILRSLSIITKPTKGFLGQSHSPMESPLFGLDARDFVTELHRPKGGAVREIEHCDPVTIDELRAVLPPPGSSLIPSFPPPEPQPAEALMPSPDPAFKLLLEIWPRLLPSERTRVTIIARQLIADRRHTREYLPDLLQDEAFAKDMLRRFKAEGLTERSEA